MSSLKFLVEGEDLLGDERRARAHGPHSHVNALAGGRRPLHRVVVDDLRHLGVEGGQGGIVDAIVVDEDDAVNAAPAVEVEVIGEQKGCRVEVKSSEAVENLSPKILLSSLH